MRYLNADLNKRRANDYNRNTIQGCGDGGNIHAQFRWRNVIVHQGMIMTPAEIDILVYIVAGCSIIFFIVMFFVVHRQLKKLRG